MSEQNYNEEISVTETVTEEVGYETEAPQQSLYEMPQQPPTTAKKGFATAALVFGILALITTLFLINYVFGILSIIFAIVYLVKKADVKPKGKAIAGLVCAIISLAISTTIWVSAYVYFVKTDITTIIEDIASLTGEEIDGRETMNQMIMEATGGMMNLDTLEQFVGGEISVERVFKFVDGVTEEDISQFTAKLENVDYEALAIDLGGEFTYEAFEAKLGEDFKLTDIMEYIENFVR